MKVILQRVTDANIAINSRLPDFIKDGLVALVGFSPTDDKPTVDYMINKIVNLRIFDDENGNLNLSLKDVAGELLLVSNFTLYADSRKGRRPSFVKAAHPDIAIPLYDYMVSQLKDGDISMICGEFGADMKINLTNNGPVTIILDSDELIPKGEDE